MPSNWLDDPSFTERLAYGTSSGNWSPPATNLPRQPQPWVLNVLIAVAVFALVWFIWPKPNSNDNNPIPIKIDGLHVLLMEQNEDREKLNTEQLAVFNSVKLRKAIDSLDGQFRLLDVDDDLRSYPKEWRALAESATLDPPFVVVANGKKTIQFEVKNLEHTIERIESMGGK